MSDKKKELIIAAFFLVPLLFLFWHRLFLGVELTDEVTYVTYAYRLYMGDVPVLDTRELQLLGSILLVPIIKLWVMVTGTLDGIMIITRISYFTLTLLNCAFIVFCIRKVLGRIGVYTVWPIIFVSYASLFNISYNTMGYIFLSGALFSLFAAFSEEDSKKSKIFLCFSGILHTVSVLSYPTFLIVCILDIFFVYLYYKKNGNNNTIKNTLVFAFSGFLMAIVISLLFLLWAKGNVSGLVQGTKEILQSPYRKTSNSIDTIFNKIVLPALKNYFKSEIFILWLLCSIGDLGIRHFYKGEKRIGICQLTYSILYCILIKRIVQHGYSQVHLFYMTLFLIALYRYFTIYDRKIKQKVGFSIIFPYTMAVAIRLFTTNTHSPLVQTFVAIPILTLNLYMSFPYDGYALKSKFNRYAVIINSFLISVVLLVSSYTYIYREEPVYKLTERIESGIYKGLFTSIERKNDLNYLQDKIDKYIDPKKTLLVANHFPAGYMMSKAKPVTPDIWDTFYSDRNLKDASMTYQYFDTVNKTPDVIIFVDYPQNTYLYNDNEFEFNNYINQYYQKIYTDTSPNSKYKLTVYEKD